MCLAAMDCSVVLCACTVDTHDRTSLHAGHRLTGFCLPGTTRYVPNHDFSQSPLEISRSFRPRGKSFGGPGPSASGSVTPNGGADARQALVGTLNGTFPRNSKVSFAPSSGCTTPDSSHHGGERRGGSDESGVETLYAEGCL